MDWDWDYSGGRSTFSSDKPWGAGVAAGLSIATNMIFLVPLAALGAVAIPIYARKHQFWDLIQSYALPAIVISFVILVIPISKSAGQFYYGATTLRDTVSSLVNESAAGAPPYVASRIVPVAFFLAMILGLWLLVKRKDTLPVYAIGCMGLSVLGWEAMHRILGFPYPLNRTAIYMLPLVGLLIVVGAADAPWKAVAFPLTALAFGLSVLYVAQIRTGYFNEWKEEAGINRLVSRLADDAADLSKSRQVTAGGTWILEYSMRYYGKRYRLPWLKVLDATERESIRPDYYILTASEAGKVDELRLKVIEKDAISGTLLARSN